MQRVGIALGSNLNDTHALIVATRDYLRKMNLEGENFLQSSLYRTEPVGCPEGSPPYLNAVVEFTWAGMAEDLLVHCMAIERDLGRVRTTMHNEPRTADVDVLYFGDLIINNPPRLVVPHPRAHLRKFVLKPLSDIRPDLVLPLQTKTVSELLAALDTDEPEPVEVAKEW